MLVRFDTIPAGGWFTYKNYWGEAYLHCRSSLGTTLAFNMNGTFVTDAYYFRGNEMVIPTNVNVKVNLV